MSGKPLEPAQNSGVAAFRALFEQETIGVCQCDTGGRILSADAGLACMLGYSAPELVGLTLTEITHPNDRHAARDCLTSLLDGGASRVLEAKYLRKGGAVMGGITKISAVRDEANQIASLLVFVH